MSFNKIIILGNLGRDPELRYTPQGDAVCSFSVAVGEKDKNGVEKTNWFKVTFWRKQAETVSRYFVKGSQIYVEGRLSVEEWKNRDGKDCYTLTVRGSDWQFVGNRLENTDDDSTIGMARETNPHGSTFGNPVQADDDVNIPF